MILDCHMAICLRPAIAPEQVRPLSCPFLPPIGTAQSGVNGTAARALPALMTDPIVQLIDTQLVVRRRGLALAPPAHALCQIFAHLY
jgi:hypothetical protein